MSQTNNWHNLNSKQQQQQQPTAYQDTKPGPAKPCMSLELLIKEKIIIKKKSPAPVVFHILGVEPVCPTWLPTVYKQSTWFCLQHPQLHKILYPDKYQVCRLILYRST